MINELLEASEKALCSLNEYAEHQGFIEEWVPRVIAELEANYTLIGNLKRELALTESQLLEAEEKIKELE